MMAKKEFISKIEKKGNDLVFDLTDVIKKGGLAATGGDKLLFVRIDKDSAILNVGEPVTKDMRKEEYIMYSSDLLTVPVVEYAKGKIKQSKAIASTKKIAYRKISLGSFYKTVKDHYYINDRMVRRYIARGLMPPPERYGRKAFYDQTKSKVFNHLNAIKTFQKCYNLSLDNIEVIINKYRDQIIALDFILADIEDKYNNPKHRSPYYVGIRKHFLEKIQKGTVRLKKLNIKTIEKEAKRKQA